MDSAQIVSTLVEKLGQTSLSKRTIESYVNRHLPKDGAEPDDSYFETHLAELRGYDADFKGQHNHEMAEAVKAARQAAVEEYLKNNPPKKEDVNSQKSETEKAFESKLEELQKMIETKNQDPSIAAVLEQNKKILDMLEAQKQKANTDVLIKSMNEKAEGLNITNKQYWDFAVELIKGEIKDGATADSILEMTKSKYEELSKRFNPAGVQPYGTSNGGNGGKSEIANYLESLKKRDEQMANVRKNAAASFK